MNFGLKIIISVLSFRNALTGIIILKHQEDIGSLLVEPVALGTLLYHYMSSFRGTWILKIAQNLSVIQFIKISKVFFLFVFFHII